MTLRIYFIRHGQTEWSLSGQHSGRADILLTELGKAEARQLGDCIRSIKMDHVLMSPLRRATQTCELVGLSGQATVDDDLAEWDNGDYQGRTTEEILSGRPQWNIFRAGCPNGEMPWQIAHRADRLIERLSKMDGNVALFSHSHFGRVLAARWIGLPVENAQAFLLSTASISTLGYDHDDKSQPAICLWNWTAQERLAQL